MEFKPRMARHGDLAAVEDIVRGAYTPYVELIGRKPGPMLDDYKALINAGRVVVVDINHSILGMLVLIPEDEAMLLDNVAVAPSAQGLGLGRKLMAHAEECARKAGYSFIRLYTNEAMTRNIEYYSRIGYIETHRAEEKGLKRVFMVKSLASN